MRHLRDDRLAFLLFTDGKTAHKISIVFLLSAIEVPEGRLEGCTRAAQRLPRT